MENELAVRKNGDLQIGKFKGTEFGLIISGSPSYEEWEDCGKFIQRAGRAAMFWVGDWLSFGEKKYGETYAQAVDLTGYDEETVRKAKWVCERIECGRRRPLSFAHHREVAPLEAAEQDEMLEWAIDNGADRNELRAEIKRRHRKTHEVIIPPGVFDVIHADPPWSYRNSGFEMSSAQQYETMETDSICAYKDSKGKPIQESFAENAVCFMWATNPLLPDALRVLSAWGFDYKTNIVWVKESHTAGFYVFGMHELLLIGVRGSNMLPDEKGKPKSVLYGKSSRHSEKPAEAYELIEAMYPNRSYMEVFARMNREGWASVGNEN